MDTKILGVGAGQLRLEAGWILGRQVLDIATGQEEDLLETFI
jgi:hypothetical protein